MVVRVRQLLDHGPSNLLGVGPQQSCAWCSASVALLLWRSFLGSSEIDLFYIKQILGELINFVEKN